MLENVTFFSQSDEYFPLCHLTLDLGEIVLSQSYFFSGLSSCVCVGSLQVHLLPPTVQKKERNAVNGVNW